MEARRTFCEHDSTAIPAAVTAAYRRCRYVHQEELWKRRLRQACAACDRKAASPCLLHQRLPACCCHRHLAPLPQGKAHTADLAEPPASPSCTPPVPPALVGTAHDAGQRQIGYCDLADAVLAVVAAVTARSLACRWRTILLPRSCGAVGPSCCWVEYGGNNL